MGPPIEGGAVENIFYLYSIHLLEEHNSIFHLFTGEERISNGYAHCSQMNIMWLDSYKNHQNKTITTDSV